MEGHQQVAEMNNESCGRTCSPAPPAVAQPVTLPQKQCSPASSPAAHCTRPVGVPSYRPEEMSGKWVMEQNTGVSRCLTSAIPASTIGAPGFSQQSTRSRSAGTWSCTVELQYHSGSQLGWNKSCSYPCTAPTCQHGMCEPQVAAINACDVTHTCMLQSDWQWQCQRPWWTSPE